MQATSWMETANEQKRFYERVDMTIRRMKPKQRRTIACDEVPMVAIIRRGVRTANVTMKWEGCIRDYHYTTKVTGGVLRAKGYL